MTDSLTTTVLQPQAGLNITIREAGHGDPVLLLHGGAGPGSIDTLITHLAASYRVMAPTHPGFGDTERPGSLSSVANLAQAYLTVLAREETAEVTVIGTSFGGWVAAEMAATDNNRRIRRLVLIDAIGPQIDGHPVKTAGPPPEPGATPSQGSRRGPSPEALAALRAYAGDDMQDPTLLQRASRIAIPTLLIWGENDPVVSPAFGRAYADAFPHAHFELIPGGGHLPMREAPDQTYTALDNFLAPAQRGQA